MKGRKPPRPVEYRIGRERIGREMLAMLDDLLGRKYTKLNEVERKLLAILLRWFDVRLRCPECRRFFKPGRPDQRFCSDKCRKAFDLRLWKKRKKGA